MQNWLGLESKVAIVTGAGGGIGAAVARAFVAVGAQVGLLDINLAAVESLADELRAAGGKAVAFAFDASDATSIRAAIAATHSALGSANVLVNNAGILRPSPLADVALEEWSALLAVNLTGYLACAQAIRPQLLTNGGGTIVHISSIAATNPQPRSGAYSPSKAGVSMLSRQLAAEWGPDGIRSNVVSPGLIRTALSESFYRVPGILESRSAMVPGRRVGTPEDVADAVVFLASARAAYVNGAELLVDGGLDQVMMGLIPRPGY